VRRIEIRGPFVTPARGSRDTMTRVDLARASRRPADRHPLSASLRIRQGSARADATARLHSNWRRNGHSTRGAERNRNVFHNQYHGGFAHICQVCSRRNETRMCLRIINLVALNRIPCFSCLFLKNKAVMSFGMNKSSRNEANCEPKLPRRASLQLGHPKIGRLSARIAEAQAKWMRTKPECL